MKVYIVIEDWFVNFQILGCFSSIEKAQSYMKTLNKSKDVLKIEETELHD